jgi:hypothetical protein
MKMGEVLVATGSISAGDNKLDYTSTNAFVEFGVDLTSYQDGRHVIVVTDSANKSARGPIHSVAPGGVTLGANVLTNGDFASWTDGNPDNWEVTGESGTDPEVSEVGTGEGHGGVGTGMCNFYTSGNNVYIRQSILTTGTLYKASLTIDTIISGTLKISNSGGSVVAIYNSTGAKSVYYVADGPWANIGRASVGVANDITINDTIWEPVTDCAATGALIVSTLGGATRSWTSVDTGFNPNLACTYAIYRVR